MRQRSWILLFSAILLISIALCVRIRTTPPTILADDETLWGVAVEHAKLGDAEQALQIAMQIRNSDTREIALQSIADIFLEGRDYQNALRVIRSLHDPYLRILYLANIMKSGKLPEPELENLVKEAEENARRVKIKQQKKFAWAAICRMRIHLGEIERAWEVAQNLPETQMRHGLWGELALLFAKQGNIDKALEIASQLPNRWKEEVNRPINPFGLPTPRRRSELLTTRQAVLKAIAKILAQQGKVEEAAKIAQILENEALRSQILDAFADAHKRTGMAPFAMKAAEETLKFTRRLEQQLGTRGLFSSLTKSLEEQVALSKTLNEARKLKTPEAKVTRLIQIAMQSLHLSQHKETIAAILLEATHYAREIKSLYRKVQALEQIAMCWERIGEREKAQILTNEATKMRQRILEVFGLKCNIVMNASQGGNLAELKEVIKRIPDPTLTDMLLEQTVVELTQNSQVKEALALINGMASKDCQRQNLIGRIAWELAELGKVEDALVLAQGLPENLVKASLYYRVAEVLRQKGQKERAVALLNEVLNLTSSLGDLSGETRKFALTQIALSFARLGETKKALKVLNRLEMKDDEILRFDFASAFAEGGDLETALKFVRQLPPERRSSALHSIAATMEQQGKRELAQKLRTEAQSIAPILPSQRR